MDAKRSRTISDRPNTVDERSYSNRGLRSKTSLDQRVFKQRPVYTNMSFRRSASTTTGLLQFDKRQFQRAKSAAIEKSGKSDGEGYCVR
jgi:hypothetical protein